MNQVFVIGSINMDIVCTVDSLPLPGETISASDYQLHPGGKGANQAVAASLAGAATALIGATGDDQYAQQLIAFYRKAGVDTSHVLQMPDYSTGQAFITVDKTGENMIVVSPGANQQLTAKSMINAEFSPGDIALLQLEIPAAVVNQTLRQARSCQAITLLNPSPLQQLNDIELNNVDIFVVNELEYDALTARLSEMSRSNTNAHNNSAVIVKTLGARGLIIQEGANITTIPGIKVDAVDTTGAGDCFAGSLAAKLAQGWTLTEAATFANQAAALSVMHPGAASSYQNTRIVEQYSLNKT